MGKEQEACLHLQTFELHCVSFSFTILATQVPISLLFLTVYSLPVFPDSMALVEFRPRGIDVDSHLVSLQFTRFIE